MCTILFQCLCHSFLIYDKSAVFSYLWQTHKLPEHTVKQCYHDGVVAHLEPDILEYEVKWVFRSITMNKVSGGDGMPSELFQILKDDAVKVLHSICQEFGKLSSGHRTEKGQVFIPIPKKGNAKECSNYHTIALISHASKVMLKSLPARLQQYVNWEL